MTLAAVLLCSVLIGLWRVVRGPTRPDRLLAVQLFGTTGTGILLLLAHSLSLPAVRDVALLLALFAVVVSAALVQLMRPGNREVPP